MSTDTLANQLDSQPDNQSRFAEAITALPVGIRKLRP